MIGNTSLWFFGLCYAGSIAVTLVSLELMRKQVNTSLTDGSKIGWNHPAPKSFAAHFSKSHVLAHYLGIMKTHRNCYPLSLLPDMTLLGVSGCIVSFVGILVSGAIG